MKKHTKTRSGKQNASEVKSERFGICHFLQTWATEAGMDPETLKKALLKSDYRPVPNERIPFSAIRAALYGEEYVEKVRGMRLDNEERERKAKERDGRLCEWDRVLFWLNQNVFGPMTSAMDAAPNEVDRQWLELVLKPTVRSKLEAPK